jgi:hypothetical protein
MVPLLRMKRPFPSSFEDIVDTAQRICDAHGLVPCAKATTRLPGHRPHVEEVARKPRQQGEVVPLRAPNMDEGDLPSARTAEIGQGGMSGIPKISRSR